VTADDPDRRDRPARERALHQYRLAAPGYDTHMRRLGRFQRAALRRLALQPGETVIDVACGTGLNFEAIEAAIGRGGRLIGIDLSPEMLAQADGRVRDHGWENVLLIRASIEDAELGEQADAALFSFTHDVLQTPAAVANVVAHLRPGGRVASTGAKLGARWNLPVNVVVRRAARPFMTTFAGLDRPWRELERHAPGMEHRDMALGGAYVAWGAIPGGGARPSAA
jgi:ubiquinone/menaquinone biosynthesis C-methylase UbiE